MSPISFRISSLVREKCGKHRDTGVATIKGLIIFFKCSFKGCYIYFFNGSPLGKLFVCFKKKHEFIEQPCVLSLSLLELFHCGYHTETMTKLFLKSYKCIYVFLNPVIIL